MNDRELHDIITSIPNGVLCTRHVKVELVSRRGVAKVFVDGDCALIAWSGDIKSIIWVVNDKCARKKIAKLLMDRYSDIQTSQRSGSILMENRLRDKINSIDLEALS